MDKREPPQPGQESVWDYPRPPRVETSAKRVHVVFNGVILAETARAKRILETSHPPVYYLPQEDIVMAHLYPTNRASFCEFKGQARYWTVRVGDREAQDAAWSYPHPAAGFEAIRDHLAFYPGKMKACFVGDERVRAQAGDFYGGWITRAIVGPFKGAPGTQNW